MSDKARRIQRKRTKGWRMPEDAVYVGRPTRWGNPFVVGDSASLTVHHGEAAHVYRDWPFTFDAATATALYRLRMLRLLTEPDADALSGDVRYWCETVDALADLRGRDLACWCSLNQPCHADVLLELTNGDTANWDLLLRERSRAED